MRLNRNLTGSLINLTIFISEMQFFLLLHCLFSSKGWVCYTSFELIIRSVGDIKSRWQDHPSCHKSQQECLEGLMLILLIIINNYFNEYSSELSYQISTSKVLDEGEWMVLHKQKKNKWLLFSLFNFNINSIHKIFKKLLNVLNKQKIKE